MTDLTAGAVAATHTPEEVASTQAAFNAFRELISRMALANPIGLDQGTATGTVISGAVSAAASVAAELCNAQPDAELVLATLHSQIDTTWVETIRYFAAGRA